MDEEQEILQSSLTQGDKISIDSFFGSPIGGLANRAIMQSNNSLKSSITNRGLIASLQASIELLKSQVQQITNYVLIDRQERNKLIRQRETEIFEREDDIQKGIVSPESAQPRGLVDSLPFFPEARFSEGLTAGMSSIGERQGVARFQERFVEGSKPFRFGGFVTGSGDADTINAKLTPGEVVIPKNVVENFSPNFFKGLISSGKKDKNVKNNNNFANDSFNLNTSISYSTRGNPLTGEIEVDPNSLEYPFMLEAANQQFYQDKVEELESEIFDAKLEANVGGYKPNISHLEEELNMYKGKYDDTLEYGTRYGVGGNKDNKEDNKEGGFFKNLFGGKKNESVKSDDKKGRDLFGIMGGTIDAATGNLTDFDKKGGKPFGLMRGITGTIDAATGGLTDLDRRGGKPFGLMRGITGIADAMTGNLFDFDRRGRGEEEKKKLRDKDGRYIGDNERKKNFQKKKDELYDLKSKIPMETTVNPDGSITSKGSGTLIGGEFVEPGQPLSENQKAAKALGSLMGNKEMTEGFSTYPSKSETPSIEPVSQDNLKVAPSESIKETSQNLMIPPPPPPSETIELPPQIQGDGGGDNSIPQAAPSFNPSTPSFDPLTGTESTLIFVEVISNPFLSIP